MEPAQPRTVELTTYTCTPSDNLQLKINALLPGDTLLVGGGTYTYSNLVIGVSGSPANEIKIIGEWNVNGTHAVLIWTGGPTTGEAAIKVTGNYLHIEGFDVWKSPRAIVVSGASHVKMRSISAIYCRNEAVWIKDNSHHILCWWMSMGSVDLPADNFTIAYRIGKPNAQWANANTPDATNNIHLYTCRSDWNPGWSVAVHEGAHHVLVEDHMFDSSSGPDHRPALGAANGDGGYFSQGSDVQFLRCWAVAVTNNYFKINKIVVGGVTYGVRQAIKGGGGRPFGILNPDDYDPTLYHAAIASNTLDLKVYRNFFDVYQIVFPSYDESGGGNWAATGFRVPGDQYVKLDIGSPARNYRLANEQLPFGQYNPWVDLHWKQSGFETTAPQTAAITYGIEFVLEKTGGWLVGYAYWRTVDYIKPDFARLYHLEMPEGGVDFTNDFAPAPLVPDFTSFEEWYVAYQAWSVEYVNWLNSSQEVKDFYASRALLTTSKALPYRGVPTQQYWQYEYLDAAVPLEKNHHYVAAFHLPPNSTIQSAQGWTCGLFEQGFWGRSWGANGIRQGPVLVPAVGQTEQIAGDSARSGFDNRENGHNTVTRTITGFANKESFGLTPPLPGEQITMPDVGMPLFSAGLSIGPIISFARQIPETVTVTPGMNLQDVLDTRIPGDTVIISGTHTGEFVMKQSGNPVKPIKIFSDGTARLRYRFASLPALHIKASYLWLRGLALENGRYGLLIENFVQSVRVEDCTVANVRDDGFVVQEDTKDVCFLSCSTTDTGLGKITGTGFRIGRHGGNWMADDHPDACERILILDCTVTRAYGAGVTCCDGATQVVVKNTSVNHGAGNTPVGVSAGTYYDPAAGFWSKADRIQFIGCTVVSAPGAGFLMFDSQWRPTTADYGRAVEIKGGSSTGQGDAGVVSQSEGLKVYADFTSTSPRIREIEGGWSAAGSSVAVTAFRELVFDSVAQHYDLL